MRQQLKSFERCFPLQNDIAASEQSRNATEAELRSQIESSTSLCDKLNTDLASAVQRTDQANSELATVRKELESERDELAKVIVSVFVSFPSV